MLQSIRNTSGSLFIKGLFVLLIASFAVWGIGDVLRPSAGSGPIIVGDRQVTLQSIDREFRGMIEQQQQALGFRLEPAQAIQFGLLDQAISNLVSRALIDNLASGAGIRVSDDTIRNFIRDELGYRTEDGRFDRPRFENFLQGRNFTEDDFVEQLRRDIARDDLLQALVGGVRVPDVMTETLRAYREETRVADFIRISAESMDEPQPPTDGALRSYYDAHVEDYMAPEYRRAGVVLVDPEALAATIDVDEERLNEEFLYRADSLFVPEQRVIEQMILSDEAQARAAAAALGEGRDFATVAGEMTGQQPDALAMGSFSEAEWFVAEVTDALFGGAAGTVSDPVQTPLGWRIYRMAAIEPEHRPTLEEVRDSLIQGIAMDIVDDMVLDLAAQFQDEIAGGSMLDDAAMALGLPIDRFGPIAADGSGPADSLAIIPGGDRVRGATFAEPVGQVSNQYDLENGGVFFVEVTEVSDPAPRPFDDVRDDVLDDWTAEQKLNAAEQLADDILDALSIGGQLADQALAHDLDLQVADGLRRDGTETGGLPRGLAATLFDVEPGKAERTGSAAEGAFYIAVLRDIVPASTDAEASDALRLQLSAQATGDVLQALGAMLQGRFEPQIQNDLIRQTFAQSYGG